MWVGYIWHNWRLGGMTFRFIGTPSFPHKGAEIQFSSTVYVVADKEENGVCSCEPYKYFEHQSGINVYRVICIPAATSTVCRNT